MSLNFPTEVAKKTLRRSYDKLYRAEFLLTNLLAIILSLILLTSLSLISLKLIIHHFQVIGNFFPNEYRESATLLTTDLLLKGGNPYALENQPEYTNVYGIFYHIIVLPFAKLFGTSFPVHRAVSAIFIFASCSTFFAAMRWRQVSLVFALSGTLILYSHLLYFTTPLAKPDSLGFFLFLCSILIPWRYKYSFLSLLVSSVLGILGFLTKPYFILSLLYLNLYLFIFKSKKLGIQQGILSLVLLVLTFFELNQRFETYFNNTILIHAYIAGHDFIHAIKQFYEYSKINLGITLIFLLCVFLERSSGKSKPHPIKAQRKLEFNLLNLEKPVLNQEASLIEFCLVLSLLLFFGKFGQHWGSWLIYIHHLISPFLIFLSFELLSKRLKNKGTDCFNLLLIFLVLINLFSSSSSQLLPQPDYSLKNWNNISALLSRHKHIFNSPAIASILIEQGKKVYDSGQSQYFVLSTKRQGFWGNIIPPRQSKIQLRYETFLQEINRDVKSKKYDLIVLTKGYSPFISENFLKKYYQRKTTLIAPMSAKSKQNWKLDIWKPILKQPSPETKKKKPRLGVQQTIKKSTGNSSDKSVVNPSLPPKTKRSPTVEKGSVQPPRPSKNSVPPKTKRSPTVEKGSVQPPRPSKNSVPPKTKRSPAVEKGSVQPPRPSQNSDSPKTKRSPAAGKAKASAGES